jgi:glycosyltransferase involved in cell wall biosynthesis
MRMTNINSLSIVVPVFNEEDNIPLLFGEINNALSPLDKEWQVIFVDDGSSDNSLQVIRSMSEKHSEIKYVAFAENCGQSAAFKAGFDAAETDVVITIDADLQNDPADIPALLREYERGYTMVIGWRQKRQDTLQKKVASKIGNAIRNKLSRETVKDTGCSLKVMDTKLVQQIPMLTGMHRFLPTLMKMQGATVSEVPVNHRHRQHGESKYGILDRARATILALLAIRWMQSRQFRYSIKDRNL